MPLRITPAALSDLAEILDYIAERSPQGARNVRASFERTFQHLETFPKSGRVYDLSDGSRRQAVRGYPFIVIYWIMDDVVEILRVRHTSRNPDTLTY